MTAHCFLTVEIGQGCVLVYTPCARANHAIKLTEAIQGLRQPHVQSRVWPEQRS